jgi:hypothetical protein
MSPPDLIYSTRDIKKVKP